MRYISIFSGIEAASVAAGPLGWEALAFSEIDPFPSAVLAARYPDVPNLGDITKIDWAPYVGMADVVIGGSPCFPAGALVMRDDGLVPIEDVRVGDLVVTHDGRLRPVTAAGSHVAGSTVIVEGAFGDIECTPNHPFWSIGDSDMDRFLDEADPRWVPASGMAGRWLFRLGRVSGTGASWVPGDEEAALRAAGAWCAYGERPDDDALAAWLAANFGEGGSCHVPAWVLDDDVVSNGGRWAFLDGFFWHSRGRERRKESAVLGMCAAVAASVGAGVGFTGDDVQDVGRCGVWERVRGVRPGREGVRVYNLEVEEDHSYVVDGVAVHNCQSFSMAGKREGLSGESGLMLEYVRAVSELRPRWFLWENVPGALTADHGEAFRCLLSSMDDLGF